MKNLKNYFTVIILIIPLLSCFAAGGKEEQSTIGQTKSETQNETAGQLKEISLPPGFKIEYFAENIPGARSMAMGDKGTLFVGTRADSVYAVTDTNGDYKADAIMLIDSGLRMPNGTAFRNGSLYVAEIHRILRYDNIEANLKNPPEPKIINDSYPADRHHGWKYIAFGPDEKLYVPVGAPCNICLREDPYATITRINPDGSAKEVYARGIRNTVGFDWHPVTGELWFTDNGRDMLGDNIPPDELNRITAPGIHFGYPFIHGNDVKDPEYGNKAPANASFRKPEIELGPHVAALGMKFYRGTQFPAKYKHQIFIAEHGSWNRSVPIGYRITLVEIKNDKAVSYKVFAQGWLKEGKAWGRPVDILELKDGSLLVSDDKAGVIYRIVYTG